MKNIRVKLTLIMVITTIILFSITFFAINFYQKNYIFDKVIYSLENEIKFFTDHEYSEDFSGKSRFFDVQTLFLEEEEYIYLYDDEKRLIDIYKNGNYTLGQIESAYNEYGEYYFLVENIKEPIFFDEDIRDNTEEEIPVMFYVDVTSSINVVNRINYIFFIMFILMIIIEGLVGIYLGSRLEDTQKKLKHFFQNASHELKSPLMSIQGYAQGISTGIIDDTKMASEIIINKSDKMRLLIDEILNISKLDTKGYILKKETIDIRDIIEDSLDNYISLIDTKKIDVEINVDEKNTQIVGDALQIYKAINTIIDNAFKFAISTVSIRTYRKNSFLYIDIYNDGEKISNDNMKHIFDRFYSANDFSTGIGLAMAKEILMLSKGDIMVKNIEDGVLFQVKLPKR